MAITRTAKGTASTKTATTVATLSSVSVNQGTTLVVAVAFDPADGNPDTVKIGKKEMKFVRGQGNAGASLRCRVYKKRIGRTNSRDVDVNWTSGPTSKVVCIIATEITETGAEDVGQSREQDATTNPSSSTPGNAPTSTVADSISLCYYASRGPSGDTAGTAGSGHTLGKVLTPITGTAAMEQALSQIEASGGNLRELNAEEMELLELFMTGEL